MIRKISFLFPGQGAQYKGMAKDFFVKSSKVKEVFKIANEIIGFPLSDIIFDGPDSDLQKTSITQPAIFLASYAALLRYQEEGGPKAQWAAGHSLGEYSAFTAAGTLSFEGGLRSVIKRGQLIQEAVHQNPGTMAAVLGLERSRVLAICQEVTDGGNLCEAVNFNTDLQIVLAGTTHGIERASALAKERGAIKVIKLNVSGPFHSSLLAQAANDMDRYLLDCPIKPAQFPVITNIDALPTQDPQAIKKKLAHAVNRPVLWEDSIKFLVNQGVTHFIELGPGRVLTGMLRRLAPETQAFSVADEESLIKTIKNLKFQEGGDTP